MNYDLPKKLNIGGTDYAIRYDFRAVLDIITALADPELSDRDKTAVALNIFYPDIENIPLQDLQEAAEKCFWFINDGEEDDGKKMPKLMDWEQDFKFIIAPINRVVGREIRDIPYDEENNTGGFHWWSFLSAYREIGGDCTFAQIVSIRHKLNRGKKLEKYERDWLRENRQHVEFKHTYTQAEDDIVKAWT